MVEPQGDGGELVDEVAGKIAEGDRLADEPHAAGVEAGEVEQVGGELREALHLLGGGREELRPRLVVEVLVSEELDEAAEGEDGRAQLVRRIRDERLPRVVELGELKPHPLECVRELPELVAANID